MLCYSIRKQFSSVCLLNVGEQHVGLQNNNSNNVLYGCETWYITLREQYELKIHIIFKPEINAASRILHN